MKKTDITVTMPMTSFNELEGYKEKYLSLLDDLIKTFDTSNYDGNVAMVVSFDSDKALEVCKKYLPEKYKKIPIQKD